MKSKNNGNKNELDISDAKKKELGILKVLSVVISEGEKDKYVCIMEDGNKKIFPVSKLVG